MLRRIKTNYKTKVLEGKMKYILKNANIIPMTENIVLKEKDLLIDEGHISIIKDDIDLHDVKNIDCSGKYIMPGLFDMHVHLNMSDMIDLLFVNGVTSVRNMWGFPQIMEWKKEINSGKKIGPRIYSTGPLTDGVTYWEGSNIVTTPAEGEASVLKDIKDSYDFIKTYPSIPKEAFLKMMSVANKKGIKVVGHGNDFLSTEELIQSGYSCIEHTNCLPDLEEDIKKIALSGMWFCPTQTVVWTIYDYVVNEGDFSKIPYYEYVNEKDRKEWDKITNWRKEKKNDPKRRFNKEMMLKKGRTFMQYSERVLLGTDTNNPGVIAGFSIHDELEYMINDFGMTPYQAIKTGTVNAARYLGVLEKTGTIEEKKEADLIILEDNPLEEISSTRKIFAIIQSGKYYSREKLDEILAYTKNTPANEIVVVYEG
jgi:imidazolonepropionase-like amidohydrolase